MVKVYSSKDEFLGIGHYQTGSIAIRIFSFQQIIPNYAYWKSKIQQAFEIRKNLNLVETFNKII